MTTEDQKRVTRRQGLSRRRLLQTGAAALAAPALLPRRLLAADAGLAVSAFDAAKVDWQQAKGASITIGVIPAGYFANLESLLPVFSKLTGVNVRFENTPPGQIRQKAVLDLSSRTGNWASHAADPMYYPLYVANKWVEPLDGYLGSDKTTDAKWFDYEDIFASWRGSASIDGKPYGIPYDGEATLQVYRTDIYEQKGLKPAETLDEYMKNAAATNDPGARLWGAALRGFKGAGQNMYIYPSIFLEMGGSWFDGKQMTVDTKPAQEALAWYVELLTKYAPDGVQNWNWPDIADAFSQGTLASYIDTYSSASVIANKDKSKVFDKAGFARWPKGPSGKRVSSIWDWSFPINAALSKKDKLATWLFVQWAASKEVQAATSFDFQGGYKRLGVNRASTWADPGFKKMAGGVGKDFLEASSTALKEDTDVDWRPRIPQWPAVGETMATAIQAALVGQAKPDEALKTAQAQIDKIMKG